MKTTFKNLRVTEFAGSNNELGYSPGGASGSELGPRLDKMHCRDCGKPVPSDRATCPHCTKQGGGA